MYVSPNFKSKKAFKEHVKAGKPVEFFQPGLGNPPPQTGKFAVEGPHYPEPHKWYASVEVANGQVVKVS
jgi:hypothetical protein